MKPLRVVVACEESGAVRRAMRANGHHAVSCDLQPADDDSPHHFQGDVFDLLENEARFDLMVAHPPCTYLCNSGVRWLHTRPERWALMREAAEFFARLWRYDIPRVAVENPVMHKYAVDIIGTRQTQIIQPWMFGHMETKATGLWLRGLPPLVPTDNVKAAMLELPYAQRAKVHNASPGPERAKLRSRTYPGIARAMADQWAGVSD